MHMHYIFYFSEAILPSDGHHLYREITRHSQKTARVSKWINKIIGYMINMQKTVVFLYISIEQSRNEI